MSDTERIILRARIVVTMDGTPIENGAVVVERNQIVAVGAADAITKQFGPPNIDLGDFTLMPGLINAHCHLDYTMLKYALHEPRSFTSWVQRLNAIKRGLHADDYLTSISKGFS